MNPFGMFQGFGQMNRSDFKRPYRDRPAPPSLGQMNRSDFRAPARSPQPPASRPAGGNGNINPYGNSPGRSNVDPYGVGGTRRVSPRPVAPRPPARRPAGGAAAADSRVPAGQPLTKRWSDMTVGETLGLTPAQPLTKRWSDMTVGETLQLMFKRADDSRAAQPAPPPARAGGQGPQSPLAVRGQTVRPASAAPVYDRPARVGAGNFNQDYRVPAGQAPMPMAPQRAPANSTASRSNAVMAPLGASRNEALVQAAGNAGMRLVDPASLSTPASNGVMPSAPGGASRRMLSELGAGRPVPVSAADFGAGSGIAQEAAFSQGGAVPQLPLNRAIGDRFSGLRPDLAAWARSNQGAARGADGLNIVDRFMAKQGAAPLVTPAGLPQTMAIDAAPGPLLTTGADIGLTAEQQTQAGAAANFNLNADLIDQVQLMREAYRNNSRPNPGAANLPY